MKSLPFLCTFFLFFCPLSSAVQITTHEENNAFTPVSITRYAHDSYITADYKHLYSLTKDRDIWFLKLLPIIDPQNLVPESNRTNGHFGIAVAGNYNPTGVYYSNKHNRLYIANYTGHNILVAQISSNPFVATITKNILHPDLKSPENVFVDDKRDLMAVADYDNSSMLPFD